ncbi:MAG: hypothetical protein V4629_04720 [Pseudomonadota bacterium]
MNIKVQGRWLPDLLDVSCPDNHFQYVRVTHWLTLSTIENHSIENTQELSPYAQTALTFSLKIKRWWNQRLEQIRHQKFLSIGFGLSHNHEPFYFVAPAHPECMDLICLPKHLVLNSTVPLPSSGLLWHQNDVSNAIVFPESILRIKGLSVFSQIDLEKTFDELPWPWVVNTLRQALATTVISSPRPNTNNTIPLNQSVVIRSPEQTIKIRSQGKSRWNIGRVNIQRVFPATLLGYGNFAKQIVIPNLPKTICVRRIQDWDPLRLPNTKSMTLETRPDFSTEDTNPLVIITVNAQRNSELALQALQANRSVIVDNPLANEWAQLAQIELAFTRSRGRWFSAFPRRYSIINHWIQQDIQLGDAPLDYHALVHRPWPQQQRNKSELQLGLGADILLHINEWLDHFLFLNRFSSVDTFGLQSMSHNAISIQVTLVNGAVLTLTLMHRGGEIAQPHDSVWLQGKDITIFIKDGKSYQAERKRHVIRHQTCHPIQSYKAMYNRIGQALVQGEPADSWHMIKTTIELSLHLKDLLINEKKSLSSPLKNKLSAPI